MGKGNIFTCVCHSVHWGDLPLERGGGSAFGGALPLEGVWSVWRGVCMGGGGVHMGGGLHEEGVWMEGQTPLHPIRTYAEIRSIGSQYAFYWNAYLLVNFVTQFNTFPIFIILGNIFSWFFFLSILILFYKLTKNLYYTCMHVNFALIRAYREKLECE